MMGIPFEEQVVNAEMNMERRAEGWTFRPLTAPLRGSLDGLLHAYRTARRLLVAGGLLDRQVAFQVAVPIAVVEGQPPIFMHESFDDVAVVSGNLRLRAQRRGLERVDRPLAGSR